MALLLLCPTIPARMHACLPNAPAHVETMTQAHGTFVVKMLPRSPAAEGYGAMSLDKTYIGDLQASAKGEFLSAGDPASGKAGYVAIERITGTLAGRSGGFALMQLGVMAGGTAPSLTALIVPGSGTGDLSGIHGSMTLTAAGKDHQYTIEYAFSN